MSVKSAWVKTNPANVARALATSPGGLFNHSNQTMRAEAACSALGIDKDEAVGDVWAHANQGTTAENLSEAIPAHGVMMFRIHNLE